MPAGKPSASFLYYSDSFDNGETWDLDFKPTQFASVCSAFNVERDPDTGYIWLAWEYNCENDNGTVQYPRTRIGLAVSTDNGETWDTDNILWDKGPSHDLGYPCTMELEDGSLLTVFYTHETGSKEYSDPGVGATVIKQMLWKIEK